MKTINLNTPLIDMDFNPVEGTKTLGQLLALELMKSINSSDPLKFYDWALILHHGKDLLLDNSDFIKLKSFVMESDKITVLGKGQILNILEQE